MRPKWFWAIAWLPLGLLVGVQLYAQQFDDWGRWATAPLFLGPVVLSVVWSAMGIVICRREAREGQPLAATATATLAAAIPVFWFVARLLAG